MNRIIILVAVLLIFLIYTAVRRKQIGNTQLLAYVRFAILLAGTGILIARTAVRFSWIMFVVCILATIVTLYISKNYIFNSDEKNDPNRPN